MSSTPAFTLVVPTYDEAPRLAAGMARLQEAERLGAIDLSTTELLFVDDGSTDETVATARRIADGLPDARVITHSRNLGKGAAVRSGILAARGPRVVFADADMSIDPALLPHLLAALDTTPIAVGSRAVDGHIDYGSRLRTDAGRAFNLAVRAVGHVDLLDTQCGFKGFRRGEALLLCQLQTTHGYAFDVELLWLARRLGLDVSVVPVTWLDVPGSSVRVLRDSAGMLLDVVMARRRSRWLAVGDLDADWSGPAPASATMLRTGDRRLLCGGVTDLGALRRLLGAAGHPRLLTFGELVELAPFECTPAPSAPAMI